MIKNLLIFAISAIGIFLVDQYIKGIFVSGFRWSGDYFSLILVYNKGVAFSMLSFLDGNLKYLQVGLFVLISLYLLYKKKLFNRYFFPIGILYGAGISNLYDRFIHGGVVDYVYWHKWFDFAVFNLADVMIDLAALLILYILYINKTPQIFK